MKNKPMKKKCFLVHYEYTDGENCYVETSFCKGTQRQLERHVNRDLAEFARRKVNRWRVNGPAVTVFDRGDQRCVSVDLHEAESFDGLPRWLVTEL